MSDIINKIFKQNCGDELQVLEKTDKKQGQISLYRCKFLNYPCEVYKSKSEILRGTVINKLYPSLFIILL